MSDPEPAKRELEIGENLGCVMVALIIAAAFVIVRLWGR